jgi:chorismate mutase / prephenate dehydratase
MNEAMSAIPTDLKGLRRCLDEIDDRLQDLLIDRAEVVSLVAASKKDGNQPAFQPAREAQIIRRLVARHHGAFPVATLVRMWREMLAATVRLQSPFSVAVFAPCDRQGLWDLARDHYGSHTLMVAHDAADLVIRTVADGDASIGVLPIPEEGEPDPWWPHLLSMDENTLRVVARLPFGARGNTRSGPAAALAIGRGLHQESGFDRTLLAMECAADIPRAKMLELVSAARLDCTFFASCGRRGSPVGLLEITGFVPISDPRLHDFRAELGAALHRLEPIGGYAVPLPSMSPAAKG